MKAKDMRSIDLAQALEELAINLEKKNGLKAEYACDLIRDAARRIIEKANTL